MISWFWILVILDDSDDQIDGDQSSDEVSSARHYHL